MSRTAIAAWTVASFALLLVATGCLETYEVYLNPDGSGKIVAKNTTGTEWLRDNRGAVMGSPPVARGVGVWANLNRATRADEESITTEGSGYFGDITKIDLGFASPRFALTQNDRGSLVLRVETSSRDLPRKVLTDEEVRKRIGEIRDFEAKKPTGFGRIVSEEIQSSNIDLRFHIPGKIVSVTNMEQRDDGSVAVSLNGPKIYAARKRLLANDDVMAAVVRAAENGTPDGSILGGFIRKEVFGSGDPIEVEFKPEGPLFDYRAEVATAKERAMGAIPTTLPASDPAMGTIDLTGVDVKNDLFVHGQKMDRGLVLSLTLKPAQRVHKYLAIQLYRIVDGDNRILEFGTGWDASEYQKPDTPWTERIAIPLPPSGKIKSVMGVFRFLVVSKLREIDLGTIDYKNGAKGAQLGFVLIEAAENGTMCQCDKRYPFVSLTLQDTADEKQSIAFPSDPTCPASKFIRLDPDGAGFRAKKVKGKAVLAEGAKVGEVPFSFRDIEVPIKQE